MKSLRPFTEFKREMIDNINPKIRSIIPLIIPKGRGFCLSASTKNKLWMGIKQIIPFFGIKDIISKNKRILFIRPQ